VRVGLHNSVLGADFKDTTPVLIFAAGNVKLQACNMVKKEEVYKATNNGLDIITFLYPDARRLVESGKLNEAFKLRPNERTPSAHMKLKDDHWIVTDFGDDQQPRNPIDLVMKEKGFEFKEAIAWIVSELNLTVDTIQPDVNRPMYEKRVQRSPG